MKRYQFWGLICGLICLAFLGQALAQGKYPNRPIEMVVPFAPGGSTDIITRCYIDDLSKELKVTINAVNRGGSAGLLGSTYVSRAKKDGYTLLQASQSSNVMAPLVSSDAIDFDPIKDFIPLARFAAVPSVVTVRSDSPFKTLGELIEYVRKNPGKLKNASAGIGSASHFNLEILCAHTKIKIPSIPFKSGGEAMVAVLGGHVDMTCNTLASLGAQIKAGKLRALAITSLNRDPDFPDIPTTTELGHPYVNFVGWQGVFAPAGVPKQVVDVLVPALDKVFHKPEVTQRAINAGFELQYLGPEEFRKFFQEEILLVEKIAKDANLIRK